MKNLFKFNIRYAFSSICLNVIQWYAISLLNIAFNLLHTPPEYIHALCGMKKHSHTFFLFISSPRLKLSCCLVAKLCLPLCDLMDCSLPYYLVRGIFQASMLEWVAISFSRGSSWPRDQTWVSRSGRQILYHWVKEVQIGKQRWAKVSWCRWM